MGQLQTLGSREKFERWHPVLRFYDGVAGEPHLKSFNIIA